MNQKKLALVFIGVNTSQWIYGDSSIPLSQEVAKLQAEGRLFIIGDKESSAADDARELGRLRELMRATNPNTINWVIVRAGEQAPWSGVNFVSEATALFINNNSNLFTYRQFFDSSSQTSTVKAQALYTTILEHNQQPQKDTAMKGQPPIGNYITLFNLLRSARQILSLNPQAAMFGPERVYEELCALRNSPISTSEMVKPGIRELVRNVIDVFQDYVLVQVELNKEESNNLIMRLDMALEELKANAQFSGEYWPRPEEFTKSVGMAEMHTAVLNAINLLSDSAQKIDRAWTIEYLTHLEAYLRAQRDKPVDNITTDGGQAEGAVARYLEQALGRLSNDFIAGQRRLEKKFDELERAVYPNLQNAFLRGPAWTSQPYGPVSPADSFPQMPDSFGFPNPFSARSYSCGAIPQSADKSQYPIHLFNGTFILHVQDGTEEMRLDSYREVFKSAYPSAKFFIANHMKLAAEEGVRDVSAAVQMAIDKATAQYQSKNIFHIAPRLVMGIHPESLIQRIVNTLIKKQLPYAFQHLGPHIAPQNLYQGMLGFELCRYMGFTTYPSQGKW